MSYSRRDKIREREGESRQSGRSGYLSGESVIQQRE